ncbi:MAG TPA: aldo/keto reductase [Methyloceanibacter sp.]|nr:aldo/keto reductase [Methyloceanibacter sp.]
MEPRARRRPLYGARAWDRFVAYSPLGRGLLAGEIRSASDLAPGDWRRNLPRFSAANLEHNLNLVEKIKALAGDKGCTAAQLALAWVLAQGSDIVPIPAPSGAVISRIMWARSASSLRRKTSP